MTRLGNIFIMMDANYKKFRGDPSGSAPIYLWLDDLRNLRAVKPIEAPKRI